jgi:transposase
MAKNKRGMRFTTEQKEEIKEAIRRGMSMRDIIKTFDISYSTYYRYAPQTARVQKNPVMDTKRVNEISGAIKLIIEVVEAVKVIITESERVKAENETLKNALKYTNEELKKSHIKENQRIALTIHSENAIQSLESRD